MDAHHPAAIEAAHAWLYAASLNAEMQVRRAIMAVPDHLVTPALIAGICAALSEQCKHLPTAPREIAHGYLDDLFEDMRAMGGGNG